MLVGEQRVSCPRTVGKDEILGIVGRRLVVDIVHTYRQTQVHAVVDIAAEVDVEVGNPTVLPAVVRIAVAVEIAYLNVGIATVLRPGIEGIHIEVVHLREGIGAIGVGGVVLEAHQVAVDAVEKGSIIKLFV